MNEAPNEKSFLCCALEYISKGWSVIPVPYNTKKTVESWKQYQCEIASEEQISTWFKVGQSNMAVICGKVSGGLTCLDFDDMEAYNQWKHDNPKYAETLPTVQTSRGRHIYFRSTLNKTKRIGKIDIKASGYCMLPPSVHPDDTVYQWLIEPNGELPLLSLKDLGMECFIEESEEIEDSEDIEEIKEQHTNIASMSSVSSVNPDLITYDNLVLVEKNYVDTSIKRTLPDKTGYRNRLIFHYCRWLKGCDKFKQCSAGQLKQLVRLWYEKALPTIGTKSFDDTWADFCYGWIRVKYPKGDGNLKIAVEKAFKSETHINAENLFEKSELKLLVRICFELQKLQKNEPFWLSCNDAAFILNISAPTATKYLNVLEAENVIKKVVEYTSTRARRYIFIEQ